MKIDKTLTDDAILAEIGERIARYRIERQLTQAELAAQAGVAKRTVERIEGGAPAQTASIIRICRVLDLLQNLDAAIPEAAPGPMELLKHRGKPRQRASKKRKRAGSGRPWTWDEPA